jgi:hypothetical protein
LYRDPADSKIKLQVYNGTTTVTLASTTTINTGTIKIAVTRSVHLFKLYINGVEEASNDAVSLGLGELEELHIGRSADTNRCLNGYLRRLYGLQGLVSPSTIAAW